MFLHELKHFHLKGRFILHKGKVSVLVSLSFQTKKDELWLFKCVLCNLINMNDLCLFTGPWLPDISQVSSVQRTLKIPGVVFYSILRKGIYCRLYAIQIKSLQHASSCVRLYSGAEVL